jgi:hypothetical protein
MDFPTAKAWLSMISKSKLGPNFMKEFPLNIIKNFKEVKYTKIDQERLDLYISS